MTVFPRITDPEVVVLAGLAASMEVDYTRGDDDPWAGSPFAWILQQPSRARGAIGEKLVAGWCATKGFDVVRSPDSEADRIIEGHRVEIKFSTLWKSGGYKFQQIREQNYEYCLCIGVSPFAASAWLLPKSVLREYVIGHMGQHTGAAGSDTAWLGFQADRPYSWMAPYGGSLSAVRDLITDAGRGPHS